jgi:hypothetical protein
MRTSVDATQRGCDNGTNKTLAGKFHSAFDGAEMFVATTGRCKHSKFIWRFPGGQLRLLAPVCAFLLHNALQWAAERQFAGFWQF